VKNNETPAEKAGVFVGIDKKRKIFYNISAAAGNIGKLGGIE